MLRWEDCDLPPPGPGEVRLRHTAIGLNFSDVNVRRGGFYIAEPLNISERQAAALMLKGLTASMVINRVFKPKPDDSILIHAAASGVGLILCQWAKHLGGTVIGTVGSPEKATLVADYGCDYPIRYREVDFVAAVKKIVPQGVSAVFDGVGKDVFIPSLDCVRPFGMRVNYGNASGHVPPVDLLLLAKKGSLAVSRPAFSSYIAEPEAYRVACRELFDLVRRGVLKMEMGKSYALRDAAAAHRDLEAQQTAGAAVLVP